MTYQVVQNFVALHFSLGYVIFMDSYYTSDVAELLESNGCGLCGTCSATRKGMPHGLRPSYIKLKKGDPPIYSCSDRKLAIAWHDTVENNTCTTVDIRSRNVPFGIRQILGTTAVSHYGQHMGGVDTMVHQCKSYLFPHRSRKWYKRIYNHLMQMAMVNAHIIYTQVTSQRPKLDLKEFVQVIGPRYVSTVEFA